MYKFAVYCGDMDYLFIFCHCVYFHGIDQLFNKFDINLVLDTRALFLRAMWTHTRTKRDMHIYKHTESLHQSRLNLI